MTHAMIHDLEVNYEIQGDGPPLLFLHGLGSSGQDWAPQVDAFGDRYECITYDVRGHGRSGKPPGPYSMARFAADAAGLLDYLKVPSANLVGLSLGGMIAFQMAVDFPERVNSMIIINSGPAVVAKNFKEKVAIWQRQYMFRLLSMERIGKVVGGRLFPDENQAELRAQFVARWSENDKPAYLEATRAAIGWSVLDHIATIATPTLVIAADQDYTPVAAKEAYVSQMPNAELVVVPDARHAVNFAQPEKVNPLIAAFLEKVVQD
jgi:3-oxoadipate enol-lactonase